VSECFLQAKRSKRLRAMEEKSKWVVGQTLLRRVVVLAANRTPPALSRQRTPFRLLVAIDSTPYRGRTSIDLAQAPYAKRHAQRTRPSRG